MLTYNPKDRFISNIQIIGFSLLIIAFLFILFPKSRIERQLGIAENSQEKITKRYTEAIINNYPPEKHPPELPDERAEILNKELPFPEYNMLKKEYFSVSDKNKQAKIKKELRNSITKEIEKSKNKETLAYWYTESLSMGFISLAIDCSEKLTEADSKNRIFWLDNTGKLALQAGKHRDSGEIYLAAMKASRDYEGRKRYFTTAVKNLMAGGFYEDVSRLIETYGFEFLDNGETAKFLLSTSLKAGNAELAKNIAVKIMERWKE